MKNGITEYYEDVEINEEYDGYFCSVAEAITIVILGSICGLKNVSQIHQWAANDRVSEFLKENFGINHVPCYYWLLCLLKLVKSSSLNRCFMNWVYSFMPEKAADLTIALDGKTIRSTVNRESYESPLHIISAQLSELGLTLAQRSTGDKSNEIPAVQELLKELNIKGQIVTADAMNCQKETAEIIIGQKADYLLCVKDNHPNLKKDIEDYRPRQAAPEKQHAFRNRYKRILRIYLARQFSAVFQKTRRMQSERIQEENENKINAGGTYKASAALFFQLQAVFKSVADSPRYFVISVSVRVERYRSHGFDVNLIIL